MKRPPNDQWVVVLDYDMLTDMYDVSVIMYTDKGVNYAFKGPDQIVEVPKGGEFPLAQRVSAGRWEEFKLNTLFANVYVKETVWKKI